MLLESLQENRCITDLDISSNHAGHPTSLATLSLITLLLFNTHPTILQRTL